MEEKNIVKNISEPLLGWYKKNKRDLPWRSTKDPYAILVSEMMLQQTQVNTVVDYYNRFILLFPSFEALAAADEQAVLHAWQGLGYYSRARNLHKLAKQVVEEYDGKLPKDAEAVRGLPGVGDYMCGALMSIAFGVPSPAVDGNVLRVVARVLGIHDDVTKLKTKKDIAEKVRVWMPPNEAGDFTQALMELGAMVCKPQNADCDRCPLKNACEASKKCIVDDLPTKQVKKKPIVESYYALLITHQNKLLMQKRGDTGLLAGMWGVPLVDKTKTNLDNIIANSFGSAGAKCTELGETKHVFTHRRWEMTVIHLALKNQSMNMSGEWCSRLELDELPIPEAFKKVIGMLPFQKAE